jgi:hypothetical protein
MSKPNLLRSEAADFLTDSGYPITKFSLQKLASTGGGPTYQIFGNKSLYTPENLLAWARAKISAPRRSTSEAA